MNRSLVFDLATANFIAKHEDALFLGLRARTARAIWLRPSAGRYPTGLSRPHREAHKLIEDLADATLDHNRKEQMELLSTVPLLIIDDLECANSGNCRRRFTRDCHAPLRTRQHDPTSNRPIEDWGKLLGDTAAVTAMLDRLLHHGHVLKCGILEAGARKLNCPAMKSYKEGELLLIGFIAFCQSRSSKAKRGIFRHPASVLAPESALGSLPTVALSSAQADSHSNRLSKRLLRYWRLKE
jgi:hypothetical protein